MYEFYDFNPYRKEDSKLELKTLVPIKEEKPKAKRRAPSRATTGVSKAKKPSKKNEDRNQSRELRIRTCPDCNGNPETEPFSCTGEKHDFEGTKCIKCWEIVTYGPVQRRNDN